MLKNKKTRGKYLGHQGNWKGHQRPWPSEPSVILRADAVAYFCQSEEIQRGTLSSPGRVTQQIHDSVGEDQGVEPPGEP